MLSKTCEYAVRATLIIAAATQEGNRISLREIARKIDSPESFTAKILQKLARNNIVDSLKGNGGGFYVSKEKLTKVTLGEIVLAIDGTALFKRCSLG
ncbi:MAG: transcriptional regulator, partial [Bacteroidetes bacterium HGW-Bacteroidetes-23]